jgi:hypothetical protein
MGKRTKECIFLSPALDIIYFLTWGSSLERRWNRNTEMSLLQLPQRGWMATSHTERGPDPPGKMSSIRQTDFSQVLG